MHIALCCRDGILILLYMISSHDRLLMFQLCFQRQPESMSKRLVMTDYIFQRFLVEVLV